MVEAVAGQKPLQPFTTVKYTTKDGENITATKKDGIVTLSGDKNGVRQMPLDDFIKKELGENVANIKLENTPEKDTVELSKDTAQPTETKATTPVAKPEAQQTAQATTPAPVTNPIEDTKKAAEKVVGAKLDVVA